jgi:hypothetical protein
MTSAIQAAQSLAIALQGGSGVSPANASGKNLYPNLLAVQPTTTGGTPSLRPDSTQSVPVKQTEQEAELSRINTEIGLREAKAKLAQGDETKWLEILSLLIPVMINRGKINAEQVDWWKKMVPALSSVLK